MTSEQLNANPSDSVAVKVPARNPNFIRVGSRRSELALWQTHHVIAELSKLEPQLKFEVHTMTTTGDAILNQPLSKIGSKSLFTGELENALLDNSVDFVVHSLKDMPTQLPESLVIGCVTSRASPLDAFVAKRGSSASCLADLPEGSVIGTSSVRRIAQLKRKFPHLRFADVRGNLNTRLRKLDEGELYSGLVLAAAGITRLGWNDRLTEALDASWCAYAVGQGALAVECRADDKHIMKLLNLLIERDTFIRVVAERAYLRKLEGGCSVPVAVHSTLVQEQGEEEDALFAKSELQLRGRVLSNDGGVCLEASNKVSLAMQDDHSVGDSDVDSNDVTYEPRAKKMRTTYPADCSSLEVLKFTTEQPAYHIGLAQFEPSELQLSQQRSAMALGEGLANDLLAQGALPILQASRQELKTSIAHMKAQLQS